MIDQFLVFTPSGIVLYRHAPRKIPDATINSLISNVFISDNAKSLVDDVQVETYTTNGYTIKYKRVNNPSLVLAAIYPSLTPLKYAEDLIEVSSKLFTELLGDGITENLEKQNSHLADLSEEEVRFDRYFKSKLSDFELQAQGASATGEESSKEINDGASTPGKKSKNNNSKGSSTKKLRKWGADGMMEEDPNFELDFSTGGDSGAGEKNGDGDVDRTVEIDTKNYGGKDDKTGAFLVKDLNDEIEAILNSSKKKEETKEPFGFLKKFTGGKTITSEDIKSTLSELQNHLIKKNVAPEVAQHLTSSVEKALVGSKTKNWTSIQATAKEALAKALTKILTPGTSVNLLQDIRANKKPYVISVVGVNGVGKSTNLSKLAFWLLQNDFKVLIVACDTFRSGAVEQLRVHVNNLKKSNENQDQIELFEGGYGGSDLVAKIAKNAIEYAKKNEFDIILMDTAGRRHNDARLMAPLASFAKAANPNKIIMVGEALVGTDSVQQAKNFNNAFGAGRTLDFFIISKCDTVGDLIGTMVNMVYATNIPILFVGVGQTYTDLRTLSVDWAVSILMS